MHREISMLFKFMYLNDFKLKVTKFENNKITMKFVDAIYQQIDFVRNDVLNGSTTIALHALEIVTATIDVHEKQDVSLPERVASMLSDSKPALAAVKVVCNYALQERKRTLDTSETYYSHDIRKKLMHASERTVKKAYAKLFANKEDSYSIATCSFSTNVMRLLKHADKHGYKLQVYIVNSVWQKRNYATILAYELHNTGILSKLITFDEFKDLRNVLDFCIIGADGFDDKNNTVNGVPSLQFAELANDYCPLYVVAESFKKIDELKTDDGFEYIPSEFITGIISDDEQW